MKNYQTYEQLIKVSNNELLDSMEKLDYILSTPTKRKTTKNTKTLKKGDVKKCY